MVSIFGCQLHTITRQERQQTRLTTHLRCEGGGREERGEEIEEERHEAVTRGGQADAAESVYVCSLCIVSVLQAAIFFSLPTVVESVSFYTSRQPADTHCNH